MLMNTSNWQQSQPAWGIVLGSGLGGFVDQMEVHSRVAYSVIEGLPQSKVAGHAGQFVFGTIGGVEVVAAAGRVHLYEGWSSREVTAHVRWMAERGIRRLILTNAAGSLNPEFAPGTWMMLNDHLNLTGTSPLLGGPNFMDMTTAYSAELRARFRSVAEAEKLVLHEGVYAAVLGPQYETPAEVRMIRTLGADAVGMSTVLEVIQARALKLEVAGFSCLTNWGAGITGESLSHQEVMETGRAAAGQLMQLIHRTIEQERRASS